MDDAPTTTGDRAPRNPSPHSKMQRCRDLDYFRPSGRAV